MSDPWYRHSPMTRLHRAVLLAERDEAMRKMARLDAYIESLSRRLGLQGDPPGERCER